MEKALRFSYYPPSDELNIHFVEPCPCISKEIADETYLRIDSETREIVGLTILYFRQRFTGAKSKPLSFYVPVMSQTKLFLFLPTPNPSGGGEEKVEAKRSCEERSNLSKRKEEEFIPFKLSKQW